MGLLDRLLLTVLFGAVLSPTVINAAADPDFDVAAMQRDIAVFAGVLRDGLELDTRPAMLGSRANPVSGYYLAGQGVVMELHTPLRVRRAGIRLHGLQGALQGDMDALSGRLAELRRRPGFVPRPDADSMRASMALSLRNDAVAEQYQQLMQQLAAGMDTEAMGRSLRSAEHSLRLLIDTEGLQQQVEQQWLPRIDELRQQMEQVVSERDQLLRQLRAASLDADARPDAASHDDWQQQVTALVQQYTALRGQLREQAEVLRERSEQAREQGLASWREEVAEFEQRLFVLLCDYGASLRQLPDAQYMTIILSGLGGEAAPAPRSDRLHVLSREALLQCQRGEITVEALRQQAISYIM
jgi:hypothetical protein